MSGEVTLSRRGALRSLGVGISAAAGASAAGASDLQGESRVVVPGVVALPEQWGTDVAGYFVHVRGPVDPVEAQVADQCEYADWDPDRTRQYDALLIDRLDESHRSTEIPLYVPARFHIEAGALFVVNRIHRCESAYTGIELENLVAEFVIEDTDDATATETDVTTATETGVTTPGFTILTGLAGITGAGFLLRWLRRQE